MFGATTTSVFAEILGYDCPMFNSAIELGYQQQLKEILVNSDKYRDSHSLIFAPDNAWEVENAIVQYRNRSNYASTMAGAIEAGQIIMKDKKVKLTKLERDALTKAMKTLESFPEDEGLCIKFIRRRGDSLKTKSPF